jgi:hypothetical protein
LLNYLLYIETKNFTVYWLVTELWTSELKYLVLPLMKCNYWCLVPVLSLETLHSGASLMLSVYNNILDRKQKSYMAHRYALSGNEMQFV